MGNLEVSSSFSSSGMAAQARRLRHVAENIANADTPGYRRKSFQFRGVHANSEGVVLGRVRLDQSKLKLVRDPSHPLADEDGYYKGSNVNMILEIADSREAQRGYEANLKMFDQTRKMKSALLDILRR